MQIRSDKKVSIYRLSLPVFILLFTIVATSCRKEKIDPVMGNILLVYDWDKLPADIKTGEGMFLRFYADDGQIYDRQSDTVGFCGYLPVGSYQVLLRNQPTPGIGFRNDDRYETAEAYVLPASRAAELIGQPDWLFSLALDSCVVSEKEPVHLRTAPLPMVHRIMFKVKITGERGVKSVDARLLNVAGAINLSTGSPVPASVGETDIPIERGEDSFSGTVLIFTLIKQEEKPGEEDNNLRLNIQFEDDTRQVVEIDVSDQLLDLGDNTGNDVEVEVNVGTDSITWQTRIIEWQKSKGPDISIKK